MLGVLLTLFVAQILLALSLPQHFRTLNPTLGGIPQQFRPLSIALRCAGFMVLLLSLALAITQQGLGLGLTYWFGIFASTGLIVVFCLENLRRRTL